MRFDKYPPALDCVQIYVDSGLQAKPSAPINPQREWGQVRWSKLERTEMSGQVVVIHFHPDCEGCIEQSDEIEAILTTPRSEDLLHDLFEETKTMTGRLELVRVKGRLRSLAAVLEARVDLMPVEKSKDEDRKLTATEAGKIVGLGQDQFLLKQANYQRALVRGRKRPAWWESEIRKLKAERE